MIWMTENLPRQLAKDLKTGEMLIDTEILSHL